MAAASIARRFSARGPSFTVSSACASSGHALGEALALLRSGRVAAVLAGGAEACVTEVALASFARMAALSTRSETPASALRPFDRSRDGFVLGEGAAMFVLESYERARARGAPIYAELAGFGASSDAFHDTQPDPEGRGAQSAMLDALADAQLEPAQVGYVNAHGTGTPLGDRVETLAIRRAFGAHADRLLVSSTKGATGHLLGASGALEVLFCALALRDQRVPPTLHLTQPDPECDLDYVPLRARELAFTAALSNSFGFGGQNACLTLTKV
jgi:3-oxoacyl-[acyl-carrier-protein] synthase II